MQHVEGLQEMAYDRVQYVAVVQRIAETGDIGSSRHVVGLPAVSHKVCSMPPI